MPAGERGVKEPLRKNKGGSLLMFDRYTVLVLLKDPLSCTCAVTQQKDIKKKRRRKCRKACSYLEYIIKEINIFLTRFWTRGSVTLHHTG